MPAHVRLYGGDPGKVYALRALRVAGRGDRFANVTLACAARYAFAERARQGRRRDVTRAAPRGQAPPGRHPFRRIAFPRPLRALRSLRMIDSVRSGRRPPTRQPMFNVPTVVLVLVGVLLAIHAVRALVLGADADLWLIRLFAFVPIRETNPQAVGGVLLGGEAARLWTFVTYALLHGGWAHLLINGVWLAAFGSPLAWRFGAKRFVLFSAVGAAAGALVHLALFPDGVVPMVGASAAISAHMAAVSRFAFATGGPLWRGGVEGYRQPAASLGEVVRDSRVIAFLGVWFAVNLFFGLSGGIASGSVAWDAHIGGFLAGLLLFPLFDPVPNRR